MGFESETDQRRTYADLVLAFSFSLSLIEEAAGGTSHRSYFTRAFNAQKDHITAQPPTSSTVETRPFI